MGDNMKIWDAVKQPPPTALREIKGGRLAGKTDINPQWRYQAMTEQFGVCGIGWKYDVIRVWLEPTDGGQVVAFAEVRLYIKVNETWSDGIPGIGGSMLIAKEKAGLYVSDECYKMAITDALSVAMKMLGFGANIYAGLTNTKYSKPTEAKAEKAKPEKDPNMMTDAQRRKIFATAKEKGYDKDLSTAIMIREYSVSHTSELTKAQASDFIEKLTAGEGFPKEEPPIEPEQIPFE